MFRNKITFVFFALLFSAGIFAQRTLSPNARISVLTCDSGGELYSLFGHTAIRVDDPASDTDVVFNYGAFDFRTPNFYLKFTRGDLQYFITTSSFADFCEQYREENRGVFEQVLNLSPLQKQQIFNDLVLSLSSADKYYTYKFIDRNCTTKVADRINAHIDGKLSLDVKGKGDSNRKIIYGYVRPHFYENLGINIMFGWKTDQDFYKVFLPMQLMESISKTKNGSQPLTNGLIEVNKPTIATVSFSFWNSIWSLVLALLLIVLANNRVVSLTFLTVEALLGGFLLAAWGYSLHHELSWNYNILLFNPVLLLLVVFVLAGKTRRAYQINLACLGMLGIYACLLIGKVQWLMFLPFVVTNAILLWRLLRQQKRRLMAKS